ncbi:hypothetical protein FF125_04795 [Aureibaculum algae]|uniref:Uncharacterized protein n=2 Tax=Aureibaculum TaxID=2706948 RepID=A0A5B7TMP0_9FLAO|nr:MULTISPECIES: hypothetical protein [Aureibaculum]MBJ2173405.1 hypothetical protein [Aureibaculum flavum]QCX37785.1 hypothetical protein FF125_04795 [Aureibaculum algae]
MFSKGQAVFGILFAIAFIIFIAWSYRKDLKLHKLYYKNVWVVGFAIIAVIAIFGVLTFMLHGN